MTRTVYTHGTWLVEPGREDEFVRLWGELAEWTLSRYPEARGTLLRDREQPNRFVSFGPWRDAAQAEEWRNDPEFSAAVGRMLELLQTFEPRLLDVVREVRKD